MWLCTAAVTIALCAFAVWILLLDPWVFRIDSCLDAGGRWNAQEHLCEQAAPQDPLKPHE